MSQKTVLITGATSGIGWATAMIFAKNGYQVVACGRRQPRLDALKTVLQEKVHTLCFDVGDRQMVESLLTTLPDEFATIDVLVNNAGNAHGLSPIHEGDPADWDAMIASNIQGLLYVTRLISPQMVARQSGHIVNIGSIAGKQTYPGGNVYCATKSAVDALSEAMRLDLNPFGIKVTAIHPGLVETEFSIVRFKGDEIRAKLPYRGMKPLVAEDVAEAVWFAVSRPPHVNIADMLILPTAQASATMVKRDLT